MALQLEYNHIRNAAINESALLITWIIYGAVILDLLTTCVVTFFMGVIIIRNFYRWWDMRSNIVGLSRSHKFEITCEKLRETTETDPENIFLGRGFVWENTHIQSYHDLYRLPKRRKYIDLETTGGGYEFIHSLNEGGDDKEIPTHRDTLQHTLIAGTTGSGKTKFFELLISQLCPNEPTVIVDPKGDKDLLDAVYDACVDHGIEDRFIFFSLAHPSKSAGFNPITNYGGSSDVADRIASIMPTGGSNQPFKNFAWQVIEVISAAMIGIQETITLTKLQRYSMDHMDELVDLCQERLPNLPGDLRKYAENSYDRLRKQANHPKEHYQKMITSLGPILTSLNTGDIAPLLNTDKSIEWSDILENNKVVYFDLASMLRGEVSNNVGKIIIQDLMYFIGQIYAYEGKSKHLNLFVDEFYSVVFPAYIDMLNKSRGAGLRMFLGMQTTADIANTLGNGQDSYVRQVLGNINNKIYLRVPEQNLAQEFCDLFGTTYITHYERQHQESSKAASPSKLFGSNYGEREKQTEVNMISPDMLMHLPVGQAFAFMEARDPYKLRLPLIKRSNEKKNRFSQQIMQSDIGKFNIDTTGSWADYDDSRVKWVSQRRY